MSHFNRARNAGALAAAALLGPWLLTACVVQAPPRVVYEPAPQQAPPPNADYSQYSQPTQYAPPQDQQQYGPAPSSPPPTEAEVTAYEAPPPLPDYEQPPCPADGYIWTPGYWRWGPGGYFWVPGTWVEPPAVGLLWTPGYWGFVGGAYLWHGGYWGPHVGYYGGVNYGFGYVGVGYVGGGWQGNRFAYNTAVTNVNTTIVHNTYVNNTVINNVTVNKVSYNGPGGATYQPSPQERMYSNENHVPPTQTQVAHVTQASSNPALSAKANGGHPPVAATPRPAVFTGPGVVGAHGATTSPLIQNFNRPGGAAPTTPQAAPPTNTGAGVHAPTPVQPQVNAPRTQTYSATQPPTNTPHPAVNAPTPPPPNQGYVAHPPPNQGYVAHPPTNSNVNRSPMLQNYQPQPQPQPPPPPKGNSTGGGKPPPNPNNKGDNGHERDH